MNFSTVPPMPLDLAAQDGVSTGRAAVRTSSGSSRSARLVKPTRSAKRTVTCGAPPGTTSAPRAGHAAGCRRSGSRPDSPGRSSSRLARPERSRAAGERGRLPARGRYAARVPESELHYRFVWSSKATPGGAVAARRGHEPLQPRDGHARDRAARRAGSAPGCKTAASSASPGARSRTRRRRSSGCARGASASSADTGAGRFATLRVLVELEPRSRRRHALAYEIWATPRGPAGRPLAPAVIGRVARAPLRGGLPPLRRRRWPSWQAPRGRPTAQRASLPGSRRAGESDSRGLAAELASAGRSTAGSSTGWRRRSRPPTTSTLRRLRPYALADTWDGTAPTCSSSASRRRGPGCSSPAGSCSARSAEARRHRATPSPASAATSTATAAGSTSRSTSSSSSSSTSARARRSARSSRPTTASAARS